MKRWMRRLAALVCCGGIALLAGCGAAGGGRVEPVTKGFTCQTTIQYQDLQLQGQLSSRRDGRLLLTFSQPKSLSGVAIGWDGSHMTMELAGVSVRIAPEKVPQGALIKELLAVLTAEHATGQLTDEGYVLTGEADDHAYTLVCDVHSGLPRSLLVPESGISATFSDAAVLTDKDTV